MGRGQELLDAAREGQRHTVEKILAQISKRSGPFTRWVNIVVEEKPLPFLQHCPL